MVRFKEYFELLKASGFSGTRFASFRVSLGGADHGVHQLEADPGTVLSTMRRDVGAVRELLRLVDL